MAAETEDSATPPLGTIKPLIRNPICLITVHEESNSEDNCITGLQEVRPQGGNQFPPGLRHQRLAYMNLVHFLKDSFRRYPCEHHQRPVKIGPVQFAQAVQPHEYRSGAPPVALSEA